MRLRRRYAIVCAVLVLGGVLAVLLVRPQRPKLYRATILPSLGGQLTNPTAINNHGQVVGFAETTDGACHFFLWDRQKGIRGLGLATQGKLCINDVGQIAGTTEVPNGNRVAFIWDRAGGMRTLGTLGGADSSVRSLNNHGQVVGWSRTADGAKHAFVWDETMGMRDLGTLGGRESEAHAINDSGQVVGVSEKAVAEGRWPVWWMSDGVAEGIMSRLQYGGVHINNRGYVAGRQWFHGEGRFLVLWRKDIEPRKLFPIKHRIQGTPITNDANQVLFSEEHWHWFEPDSTKFFPPWAEHYLWDPNRGKVLLDSYVSAEEDETLILSDLNDSGCIVGALRSGSTFAYGRGVLLEPIPERWGK